MNVQFGKRVVSKILINIRTSSKNKNSTNGKYKYNKMVSDVYFLFCFVVFRFNGTTFFLYHDKIRIGISQMGTPITIVDFPYIHGVRM